MIQQDSFTVFHNPVDSTRIAAQDITSTEITKQLDITESLHALWNLVHIEYIAFVCVTCYIVVTRIQAIKIDSKGRRNLLVIILTIVYGVAEYFLMKASFLSLFVTALFVNAAYEYIFKWIFKLLEKLGWTPLPEWRVDEIRVEKAKDVVQAESVQKPETPKIAND